MTSLAPDQVVDLTGLPEDVQVELLRDLGAEDVWVQASDEAHRVMLAETPGRTA
jgi:hypothetical protein